jgi:hypothetical protein
MLSATAWADSRLMSKTATMAPFLGKPAADRATDATRAAGDHNHFVFQSTHFLYSC